MTRLLSTMTSYHRILKLFGRSVDQYTLQCNCDLHPWQVSNGEQWGCKIRLVAFIDTVFLIRYTQKS
ncbi:hypothetical protein M433DRAFT_106592 [Acidomyces richmondensis BFW]|nr:MAG: hypothetical protein FE78DRAFT_164557 [Acidomyces sp. 'richmondensis']KYG46320.1 hypothetical protein M433DRAFT_106592 [Acidomyces richmondensis BFW]